MFGDLEPLLAWKDMVCVVIKASRRAKESWSDEWNVSLSGRRALLEELCGQHDLFPDSSTAKTLPKAEMTDTAKQTACVVSETLHVCHERQQNFLTHLCLISFRLKATKWIKHTKKERRRISFMQFVLHDSTSLISSLNCVTFSLFCFGFFLLVFFLLTGE